MVLKRLAVRRTPLIVTALVVTTGMAFSFFWMQLTQVGFYHGFWLTPGDIWTSYRTAHWVGWGAYGSLYSAASGYHTFPGLAIVLAPIAMLTRALGLSECLPLMIPHPTAWLVLGPFEMVLGCSSLFALDALAERLRVTASRRSLLCVAQGILLWPMIVVFGHPEDAVAIALAVYAVVSVFDRRWARAGWFFAAAIAFQPLVLLMLPIAASRAPLRQSAQLFIRAVSVPVALLVVPFGSNWHDTWASVVEQPTQLAFAHVTPWTALAPRVAAGIVSCGPTRLIALVGSCLLGWSAARRQVNGVWIVWCAALCMGLRFVTESALEGYYIWPALALFLVVASTHSLTRLIRAGVVAVTLTIATSVHFSGTWWIWWGLSVSGLVFVMLSSVPFMERRATRASRDIQLQVVHMQDQWASSAFS